MPTPGDVREDGFIFKTHEKRGDKVYEKWMSPSSYAKKQAYQKEWSLKFRERTNSDPLKKAARNAYAKAYQTKVRPLKVAQFMFIAAKCRAKRTGIEFDIEKTDVVIPERCPVLGLVLQRANGICTDNSPELDRIDNTRGYVKGNVMVISRRANRIKNDASVLELMMIADFYQKLFKKKPITFDIAKLRMLLD